MRCDPPSIQHASYPPFTGKQRLSNNRLSDSLYILTRFLIAHYTWFILFVGIAFIVLEGLEHYSIIHRTDFFFSIELLLTISLLSTLTILFKQLLASMAETAQANQILQLKHEIALYLSTSRDIDEVSKRVVQKAMQVVPGVRIALFLADPGNTGSRLVSAARADGSPLAAHDADDPDWLDLGTCRRCLSNNQSPTLPLSGCAQVPHAEQQHIDGYCMHLVHGNRLVGMLHFYGDTLKHPVERQIQLLEHARPEIASALLTALESRAREESLLTQKVRDVQLDIARDLHDTIGQNIGYLRMRLNYLADKGSLEGPDTTGEIQHMFTVAKESYDLIRGTMAVLQSSGASDMEHLFERYAAQVGERSKFEITFHSTGQPKLMQASPMLHLFLIFREALSNIEKHAGAANVSITMDWGSLGLALSITDDGRGFDLQQVQGAHYGLKTMQDRANHLRGSLSIRSAPGAGTTIQAQVPTPND